MTNNGDEPARGVCGQDKDGRFLIADAVGSDDEEEETMESLRRERDDALRREGRVKDQLLVLATATKLLTRLVTSPMEGGASNSRDESEAGGGGGGEETQPVGGVGESSMPVVAADDAGGSCCKSTREEQLLNDLHTALNDHRIEETGFPALFNGFGMLRESLRLTAIEADEALDEARAANEATKLVDSKLRAASRALGKLYKENRKLKTERKTLAREVNEFVGTLNSEKERQLNEAYALMAHEQVLSPMTASTSKAAESFIGDDDMCGGVLSFPSSPSPAKTLVTEGGGATVRFFSPIDDDSSTSTSSCVGLTQEQQIAISRFGRGDSFQSGGSNGEESSIPVGDVIGRMMNRSDVDRGLYHIDFFSKSIGIKLRAIPASRPSKRDGKGMSNKRTNMPPLSPLTPTSAGTMKPILPGGGNPSKVMFVVSGFSDYDLSLDKRPELGARLVAVNGTSLECGKWTLKSVCDKIRTRDGEGGVRLGFRNDILSQDDVAYLNKILSTKKDANKGEKKSDQSHNTERKGVEKGHCSARLTSSPNMQQKLNDLPETPPTGASTPTTTSLVESAPEIPTEGETGTPRTPTGESITIQDCQEGQFSPLGFRGGFKLPYRHRREI